MNVTRIVKLAAVLCLFLAPAPFAADAPLTEREDVWAQTYSDLTADPQVRFGQLPNGMRYAIMHNALPVGQVALRLRFATGSLAETDAQQGLAHFLEHMAFKGSTNIPPDGMIKLLERLGLSFGGDTNASTSTDETVYRLDLPKSDAETLDAGMMVLREVASELTLSQEGMDKERGVILSEERARDSPGYRVSLAQTDFLFPNQLVSKRNPIGKVEIIKNAPVSEMAAYYRARYRPDRTTLIVAGDIDVNAIEAKIKTLYSSWENKTKTTEPDRGRVTPRKTEAHVAVQTGVPVSIGVYWMGPYDNAADTKAIRKRETIRGLAMAIVNRRFGRVAQQPQPPFRSAGVSRGSEYQTADLAGLSVSATPETWEQALIAAETLRRQAVMFGVSQDELDAAITESRTSRQNAVAGESTRRTPQLAGGLLGAAQGNGVFMTPTQNLALFEDSVKGLTAMEVSAALPEIFKGEGPLLFMSTPEPVTEAALLAAFSRAQEAPIAAAVAQDLKSWPYGGGVFGAPGREIERRVVKDLDTTFIRFANGLRLTVKPTTFTRDQILVRVRIGDGLLALPRDRMTALWATSAFVSGGLETLNQDDIRRIFGDKVASVGFAVGEDSFELSGGTRAADLDMQMQLIAAQVTAPGYRPEAFERIRLSLQNQLDRIDATPNSVLGYNFSRLIHDGDIRWRQPDRADLAAAKPSDVRDLIQSGLSRGEVEIVVVGDTTVDQVAAAVAATFGAMPARPKSVVDKAARAVKFPAPTPAPTALYHKGRGDQAIAIMAWRTDDFYTDTQRARATRLAEQILRMRLTEQFRTAEGNTYSPGTGFEASDVFPHYGYVLAQVETPPEKIGHFYEEVEKIVADMRVNGVTDDELQRAVKPRIAALDRSKQTNGYWVSALGDGQTDPKRLDAIRMTIPGLEKVTTADVKKAAALYFVDSRAWKVTVQPASPE